MQIQGSHAAVIGLGESGLAMARWLAREGARLTVLDSRAEPPGAAGLASHCPQARRLHGAFALATLEGAGPVDLLAWSPGLSPVAGAAASLYREARAAGLPVVGELDLFADALAAQADRPQVLAITGTNGKTTVTQLVAHLCREAGVDAQPAGNIGPALLDALRDRLDAGRLPRYWILELSSFQLALSERFACSVSAILNVTQDHLDWHGDMAAYRAAKLRIHHRTGCRIVNLDDAATDPERADPFPPAAAAAPAEAATAGPDAPAAAPVAARVRGAKAAARKPAAPVPTATFTLGAPAGAPGFGLVRDGGIAWLAEALVDESQAPRAGARRRAGAADEPFVVRRLMPADALRIRGAHNQANALAALALLRAAGVPMAPLLRGLRDFEAGDHRCTLVAIVNGVEYIDDSKGTNVGATVAALSGLGKRCVLIAGGLGKEQDFAPLAAPVRRHAKAVVLIGRDAPRLRAALADTGVDLVDRATLADAVATAAALARSGEAVLLSPACASMDMFRNYGHRAEVFAAAVRELAEEAGQPC